MPVCTSFSLCVKHMVKCMHCFPLLHSSYSSSCSFCVLSTCLCEFKCIGIICQWFGNNSRVGGACETSGDGHVKVKMVAMVQRAFHLMFYSMSQYIEALNNLRCFLLSFIPLSPCPSFSRQRLMYQKENVGTVAALLMKAPIDVLGTSVIIGHLHLSWLLHFV